MIKFDSEGNELSKIDNTNLASCAGATNFNNPFGVAVDPANGDVYVSDLSTGTVSAFDPAGTCLFQTTQAAQSAGRRSRRSHSRPQRHPLCGRENSHTIEGFDAATGAPISSFGSGPGTVLSIAVDSSGNIFVDSYDEKVVEYDPSGECVNACAPIDTNGPSRVAIDPRQRSPSFVAGNSQIAEYAPGRRLPRDHLRAGHRRRLASD